MTTWPDPSAAKILRTERYRGYYLEQLEECVRVRDQTLRAIFTSHTIETAKVSIDEREWSYRKWTSSHEKQEFPI